MTSFRQLGLSEPILQAIEAIGFRKPSAIQEEAIPQLIHGSSDFIGLAQTGTGKTAAFGLPLLELIDPQDSATQALILAPTRELGRQIAEQIELFAKFLPKINVLAVYGGTSIQNQIQALKKPQHIVIATPGRLVDLIGRKKIHLEDVRMVVLDEADEMLNMGFKEDIDKILSYTPDGKLTWLFSATMPKEIRHIVKQYMHDPARAEVNSEEEVNANITHQYAIVHQSNKAEALMRFLDADPDTRAVVFCRTKRDTQTLADTLGANGYKADAIHGDLSQAQRDQVMKKFKQRKLDILVATDVAARGIDVNDLSHVYHYLLPDDLPYYTHRSGRTARAGKKGLSISLVGSRDKHRIQSIARKLNIVFERIEIPNAKDLAEMKIQKWMDDVMQQSSKPARSLPYFEEIAMMFSGMTKEELLAKVLSRELQEIAPSSNRDLNEQFDSGHKGGRGGRSRKKNRYKGKRNSNAQAYHRRKGGKSKGKRKKKKG